MNFFDKLKKQLTDRAKAPVLRELDRAIHKLDTGESVGKTVPVLRDGLLGALRGYLPPGLGEFLLDMILAKVDWDGLLNEPSRAVSDLLDNLRGKVKDWRL